MTSPPEVPSAVLPRDSSTTSAAAAAQAAQSRNLNPGPSSPTESLAAKLSQRRELGLASRHTDSAERLSLDSASDENGHNLRVADSQVLVRGIGDDDLKEKVTNDPEGSVELNVHHGTLTMEDSAQQSSKDKSAVSHGNQPSRQTVSVRLDNLSVKGHLILKTDDPELKDIIQKRLQREIESGSGRKRSKFSELSFTPRFTVFDRQNTESSLFRGFYTLFWLATFFMVVKVGARNWSLYGSIFGGNEILSLTLQRDLLVLGLTDGVLCASTAFCLLLQRLILAGYLSWDRQGWIVQNVSHYSSLTLTFALA